MKLIQLYEIEKNYFNLIENELFLVKQNRITTLHDIPEDKGSTYDVELIVYKFINREENRLVTVHFFERQRNIEVDERYSILVFDYPEDNLEFDYFNFEVTDGISFDGYYYAQQIEEAFYKNNEKYAWLSRSRGFFGQSFLFDSEMTRGILQVGATYRDSAKVKINTLYHPNYDIELDIWNSNIWWKVDK